MTTTYYARALCALAFAAASTAAFIAPVHADSFASSASSAGSASSASISDSISSSSNSSSGDDRMAAGQYRVIDIALAPAKAHTTRMTLRAVAMAGKAAQDYHLDVPNRALAQRGVAVGELVQVNERVYGYEFAYADTRRPFFLALQDDWQTDLGSRKVTI